MHHIYNITIASPNIITTLVSCMHVGRPGDNLAIWKTI